MPEDASYTLLSVSDAAETRRLIGDVIASERVESGNDIWSDSWWPLADNGGGDVLVLDCGEGKAAGQILKFSHETRRATPFKKSVLALMQTIAVNLQASSQ